MTLGAKDLKQNWRMIGVIGVAGCLLGLTSCTPQIVIPPSDITPAMANAHAPNDPYFKAICVAPGSELRESLNGYNFDIPPDSVTIALTNALTDNNFYALNGDCKYTLTATVDHFGRDYIVSMPFAPRTMNSTISYRLVRTQGGAVVINKTLTTEYSQNWIFTFPADQGAMETFILGTKGAVRNNIGQFVASLP